MILGCGEYLNNINFPFNDVSLHENIQTADACNEICKEHDAFSWHTSSHSHIPQGCWCKDSIFDENVKLEDHVISGKVLLCLSFWSRISYHSRVIEVLGLEK